MVNNKTTNFKRNFIIPGKSREIPGLFPNCPKIPGWKIGSQLETLDIAYATHPYFKRLCSKEHKDRFISLGVYPSHIT